MSDGPYFVCPRCGARSYNPNDLREGYCGRCKDWTGKRLVEVDPELLVRTSRIQTGMTVLGGTTVVMMTVYGLDPTVPLAIYSLPAAAGLAVGEALMDTSRKAIADQQ